MNSYKRIRAVSHSKRLHGFSFKPKRIIFEKGTLDYPLGQRLYTQFKDQAVIEMFEAATNQVKKSISGNNLHDIYHHGVLLLKYTAW